MPLRNFVLYILTFFTIVAAAEDEVVNSEKVATVQSSEIDENSGVAFSFSCPNAVWTHNDSGGKPHLFLVSTETGETLHTVKIKGSLNKDWEDIVSFREGDTNYIAVADVGDNARKRDVYEICIIEEPEPAAEANKKSEVENWISLKFRYEDESRNCESVGYDSLTNSFVLIEKVYPNEKKSESGVFTIPFSPKSLEVLIANQICSLPPNKYSAMDIDRESRQLFLRAYHDGFAWSREAGETWRTALQREPVKMKLPWQRQGEGACFYPNENAVLISTEKKKRDLLKIPLDFLR